MIVDDIIIKQYLAKVDPSEYNQTWIYSKIEEGQYLFEEPVYSAEDIVKDVYYKIIQQLKVFRPLNEDLFTRLFPDYHDIFNDSRVMLIVGAPDPYDAMVKSHQGHEYIVFDLIRLAAYVKHGYNVPAIVRQLLTHEIAHRCLHHKYPYQPDLSYMDKMNYMTFDEGFAHLLSYKDEITGYDFNTPEYEKRFAEAKKALQDAINEKNPEKQKELLIAGDSGRYWDKFSAISGKLYLAKHIKNVACIYSKGWKSFVFEIQRE